MNVNRIIIFLLVLIFFVAAMIAWVDRGQEQRPVRVPCNPEMACCKPVYPMCQEYK